MSGQATVPLNGADASNGENIAQKARNAAQRKGQALTAADSDDGEASPAADSEDFDWRITETVIIEDQPRTVCYQNPARQLVLRQKSWPDDDRS